MAESVHQLLRGNTVRAGATLDAIARGDAPPPEIDVIQTPRSGTALYASAASPSPEESLRQDGQTRCAPKPSHASMHGPAPCCPRLRAFMREPVFLTTPERFSRQSRFGLDALAISPLDLLALPETDGLSGELAERLLRAAVAARPASVPATATVSLVGSRDSSWPAATVAISELMELVNSLGRLVSGSRALTPEDLIFPGDAPGGIDPKDIQTRADAAETQIHSAATALQASTGLDTALLTAANFGVANAIPSLDATQWLGQATSALAEINTRIAALNKLATGFTRTGTSADVPHDVARLRTIFGQSFLVLPALDATLSGQWIQFWSNSPGLQGNDALAATTWLQRMARIRPGVSRLHQAILYGESLTGATLPALSVAQLPQISGERWVALPKANISSSRISLVAFTPQAPASGAAIAGLIVDEWIEVLPSSQQIHQDDPTPQQITGLSFHQDDPTARAPQSLLLAVRPDDFPEWTLQSLEGTVLEAIDLAKLRAVDMDALGSLGHYLPALYFAYNAGGPQVEAISTDFNLARATSLIKTQ